MTSRHTHPTLADHNRSRTHREVSAEIRKQEDYKQLRKAISVTAWTAAIVVSAFLLWLLHDYSFEAGKQAARVTQRMTPQPVRTKPPVYDWMDCAERARVCRGRSKAI